MLIKNGTIVDGTGEKQFKADIRISEDKIKDIGNLSMRKGEEVIDATGKYVVPGFVDILNHSDAFAKLFETPSQESLLQQGITTALMGTCGSSLAPLTDGVFVNSIRKWGDVSKLNVNWLTVAEFFEELSRHKFGINIATLVGHSTVRRALAGDDSRVLTEEEMQQMEYMINQALEEGAFGVSVGLAYAHGRSATKTELEKIAIAAKSKDALFSVHMRDESEGFLESILEVVKIAKNTNVNLEVSHMKATGEKGWDQFEEGIKALDEADNVNFDTYPYTTTATVLYSLLPNWASEGGNSELFKVIDNPETRKKLLAEMRDDSMDYANMVIAMGNVNKIYFGKSLGEIAKNQESSPEEVVLSLIKSSNNRLIVFNESIKEENLLRLIQHKKSFVCADSVGYNKEHIEEQEVVHPRYFGAFPRFIREYVKENSILTIEEAVRKMTLGPAEKIGITSRGKIAKNYFADITIFDREKIQDKSTFTNPYQNPAGIHCVIVNGKVAVKDGQLKNLNGNVLVKNN